MGRQKTKETVISGAGEKRSLLGKVSLFSELKKDEIDLICSYSEFMSFADDEVIFKKNSDADSLMIVSKGMVRILAPQNGEMRDIAQFIQGELFGEMDLFEENPRIVDAVAETPTEILRFPKRGISFESLLKKYPEIFARILQKLLAQIARRTREANKLVSEKVPWIDDLRKQLFFDKLTGLYNKTYLEEDFVTVLKKSESCAVFAIKPDNFKIVNDEYGHDAGDRTLRLMADAVQDWLGDTGMGVRYRGDEYIGIWPNINKEQAKKHGEALLQCIREIDLKEILQRNDFSLVASIGCAVYPEDGGDAAEVSAKAIELMFQARNDGGNRYYEGE
ncbi:MAG: GGDEF domain-containing protein [Spirochaetales bacterium]|nr:GGDEF domain-containing protein [Spirochaetales bacterium]